MGPAGWLDRGRRALYTWWERSAEPWRRGTEAWNPFLEWRGSVAADIQHFLRMDDSWGAAATLRRHLSERLSGRFFAGLSDEALPARLLERCPDERQRILAEADALCEGRFDLLGYRGLTFGDPVDWHLDPVARRRVPLLHWSRINPFDVALCGDSRLIWALNRHQWLVLLGEAYRLTGEWRYAERFEDTIRDWIRVNPAGLGINWASSREVAYRLVAWCWALVLFWPAPVLTADLLTLMLDEMRLHALHIERYPSYGGPPNWPLTVEASALFYVGCLFPELRRAAYWRRKGQALLERHVLADLSPEGRSAAPSTSHHRRMAEAALHMLVLADRNAVPVAPLVRERVRALLHAALPLRRPDGLMMQVGEAEADGEWMLPLLPRHGADWRGLFAVAAAVLAVPQYAWAAGGLSSEVVWFLGTAGAEAFDRLAPAPPDSAAFEEPAPGGCVPMRSGWERESHQLVFGSFGDRADAGGEDPLGIQCATFGEPVVIDAALSGPAGHREWQAFIRMTSQRSTVLIDGLASGARPSDQPARRTGRPRAVLRQWCRNERFELADADDEGSRCLPQPVVHRRRVLFVKRAYWVLIDDVQGAGRHRVDLVFQLAAQRAQLDASLWATVWTANGPGLAIKPFADLALRGTIQDGVHETAGRTEHPQPVRTLCYSAEGETPIRLVTILFPLRDERAAPPNVTPFADERGRLSGLAIDDPPATILYSDHSITVEAA